MEEVKSIFSFPPLYTLGARGQIRIWEVGFDDDQNLLWTRSGQQGGAMTVRTTKVATNKSGRSLLEQAELECASRHKKKRDEGFVEDLTVESESTRLPEPMCGQNFRDDWNQYPCLAQCKLDGVRFVCQSRNGVLETRSRKNQPFKFLTKLKADIIDYLDGSDIVLDGELYSLDLDFHTLSGVSRTKLKPSSQEDKMIFAIFDTIDLEVSVPERQAILDNKIRQWSKRKTYSPVINYLNKDLSLFLRKVNDSVYLVRSWILNSPEELDQFEEAVLEAGMEGVIIRQMDGPRSLYQCRRSQHLLKVKRYQDYEGIIEGFSDGTGTEEGKVIWHVRLLSDETSDHPIARGEIVKMRPTGDFEQREKWFQNGENYLGRKITYKCLGINTTGIPREPIVIRIRDE